MSEPTKAVFLSYASQDAEAAKRICEALRSGGVEVWFDADGGLEHGDEWDAKIRRQIKECVLFIPVISANTQARHEGYFRIEWELAAQRAMGIASGVPFILPVVIDDTREPEALVPDRFRMVQWTKLRGGEVPPEVQQRFLKLWSHRAGVLKHEAQEVAQASSLPSAPNAGWKPALPRTVGRRVPAAAWAAAVIAIWAAAAGYFWLKRSPEPAPIPAPNAGAGTRLPTAMADVKSVAVLPFANLSGDPAQEYFSDGLTEEILNALARERDLRVVPRTSAFSFKGKNVPLPEIAKALNVAQVIEGSVQRIGNRVRILCTCTRVADGFAVPLLPFDRELKDGTDIFALEDDVARAVVQKLTQRDTTTAADAGTTNLEVYDRFLRARALQFRHANGRSSYEAMQEYEEIVRLDPKFGLAWAQLADVAAVLGTTSGGFDMSESTRARSVEAASQAVRLTPNLADAHVARAVVCLAIQQDLDGAARELQEAERLQPFNAGLARMRATVEASTASNARLLELVTRAVELDPQNTNTLTAMGQLLWRKGDFAHADVLLKRATLAGQSLTAFLNRGLNWAAWTGDIRQALSIVNGCPESFRNELFYRMLAPFYEQESNEAEAVATWKKAREMAEKEIQTPAIRSAHALILSELGRHAVLANNPERAKGYFDQARREIDQLLMEQPHTFQFLMREVQWLAAHGRFSEALATFEKIATAAPDAKFRAPGNLTAISAGESGETKAGLLAQSGQSEAAIDQLQRLQAGGRAFGYTLRLTPEFKSLQGIPAFQALMREAEARADAMPHPKE